MPVRVRFAPSPTGWIHIGGMRTILFNYFLWQKEGGEFVLRIEDTDQKRALKNGVEGIVETLQLFGIMPNEGYGLGGEFGPYIQSERLDIYKKHAEELIEKGHAYRCFCSSERLTQLRESQKAAKIKTQYDGHCRNLSAEEVKARLDAGESHVIRMKVTKGEVLEYEDLVYGKISFNTNDVEDQVLLKSDGYPTYHLAVVVDDHLMKINLILRGEDWQSSTPKQILLYRFFGWEMPKFAHVPNVLNPDKKGKLSKRKGDSAVIDFLRKGYTIEGLTNYLSLVGWNPDPKFSNDDEFYTRSFLVEHFEAGRIKRSNGAFDNQKLMAINAMWLNKMSLVELEEKYNQWKNFVTSEYIIDEVRGEPEWLKDSRERIKKMDIFMGSLDKDAKNKLFEILHERIKIFSDVWDWLAPVFPEHYVLDEDFSKLSEKIGFSKELSEEFMKMLFELTSWDQETWEPAIRAFADLKGLKHGDVFMLLRYIVTGKRVSLPLREFMEIIGKEGVSSSFENFKKAV